MMPATKNHRLLGIFCVLAAMLGNNSGTPICKYGGKLNSAGECVCPNFNNCTKNEGVCGSNGINYRNECDLKQDACDLQKHFFVFKKGMCGLSFGNPCSLFNCSLRCPYGLVQDSFGCLAKCKCRASLCTSMSSCHRSCDGNGGVVVDDQHCPTCQCM